MQRGRFIFAAALALATTSAQAATLVNTDFTLSNLSDASAGVAAWRTAGTAGLELNAPGYPPVTLALTHNVGSEGGAAWTIQEFTVPSFSMWADVNIDFNRLDESGNLTNDNCPADGIALAFASIPNFAKTQDVVGGAGGSLGLYGRETVLPRFIAFEVNTWKGQALEDTDDCSTNKFTTFAFADNDVATVGVARDAGAADTGGGKVGQVAAGDKIVNGGWYRYQWNVDTATGKMEAYITGLDDANKAIQNKKVAEVTFSGGAPKLGFAGRFGITAGTGGAVQGTRISHIRVDSPAVAAGAPPTAGN
jgi:hypothetical protein